MRELAPEVREELKEMIYEFFAEECEVELSEINNETNISDDLDGDSLLFVELVELIKNKYDLDIQLQAIGKYLLKNPAETIEQVVETTYLIYQYENDIINQGE